MSKPTSIRDLRETAGISQQQLAAATGMTQGYISQLESGSRQPSIGTLRQLSRALGCKQSKLLGLLPETEG